MLTSSSTASPVIAASSPILTSAFQYYAPPRQLQSPRNRPPSSSPRLFWRQDPPRQLRQQQQQQQQQQPSSGPCQQHQPSPGIRDRQRPPSRLGSGSESQPPTPTYVLSTLPSQPQPQSQSQSQPQPRQSQPLPQPQSQPQPQLTSQQPRQFPRQDSGSHDSPTLSPHQIAIALRNLKSPVPSHLHHPQPQPRLSQPSRQQDSPPTGQSCGEILSQTPLTPASSKAEKYVGVDAGTQYSPMETPKHPAQMPAAAELVPPFPAREPYAQQSEQQQQHKPEERQQQEPQDLQQNHQGQQPQQQSHHQRDDSPLLKKYISSADLHLHPSRATGPVMLAAGPPPPPPPAVPSDGSPGSKRATNCDDGVVHASGAALKRARPAAGPRKPLPRQYEECPVEDVVVLIAHMISELIETNDSLALAPANLTRFHSRTAPGISVLDYLHRLARHATLTPPLLLAMVYYIDRLCALYPEFTINTLTVHRFLITAATVASKGLSDSFWNNSTYARVGGVRVAELKLLELEFLYRVDWRIVPNPEVLVAYYQGLVQRHPDYKLEGDDDSRSGSEMGD